MYCNKCGQPIPDGSVFCNACGSKQAQPVQNNPQPKPQTTYCVRCGEVISGGSSSCNYCGATQPKPQPQPQYRQAPPPQQRYPQQQKKKGVSPIIAFGIIFFSCCFGLVACFGNSNSNKTPVTSNTVTDKPNNVQEQTQAQTSTEPQTLARKTNITMTGHHLTTNASGQTVLVVEYDYYNGENKPQAFMVAAKDQCFQNGIECSDWVLTVDEVDAHKQTADVQPGITNHVVVGYLLEDMSDVNIVVKEYFGKKVYVDETFSPQE